MQRKQYSDRHLFADLDGIDDVHQIAKFTLRAAADAAPALAAFAMRGASVQACGRSVGAVLENDILKTGRSGDIRFAVQVTSRSDGKLIAKSVVHGAKIAAHSMWDGGVHIDGITLQDMAPQNLGDTHKSNGEETLMKSSGTFGTKHIMKLGRGGGAGGGLSTAEFLDLVKGFRKASSSNIEHLGHALDHLGKVGGHLTAAKARYPFDNNVRGAASSHEAAMECLKKIDLPEGEADAPALERPGSGKPESADSGARASTPRFLGPDGSWDGVTTGARPDPRVTETEPGRKAASIGPDAFVKAFGEHRASSRRSVTFRR